MDSERTLDCRGLACPQPVLATKAALEAGDSPLLVMVGNESSCTNVRRFAESRGAQVEVRTRGTDFVLAIRPNQGPRAAVAPPIVCDAVPPAPRTTVVYVSSERMGRGDDELGATLMAAFLDTASHFGQAISHVVFVNAGARLAVAGSPVLEQIRQLEELGAQVLVCGTCLNHFGIKEQLAVGSVSNMYAILETLAAAERIIQP